MTTTTDPLRSFHPRRFEAERSSLERRAGPREPSPALLATVLLLGSLATLACTGDSGGRASPDATAGAGGKGGNVAGEAGRGGASMVATAGAGGLAGDAPTAGAGGLGVAGHAASSGQGGAGGVVSCLGDVGSSEPCSYMNHCDGGAGGDVNYGMRRCWRFETGDRQMRPGVLAGFKECVAPVNWDCDAAATAAVHACEEMVADRACPSSNATQLCASLECSELSSAECERMLGIFTDAAQRSIWSCVADAMGTAGAGGATNCEQSFFSCL